MALRWRDLIDPKGTTGRRAYAISGAVLFALKYNLDRILVFWTSGEFWMPWAYFLGLQENAGGSLGDGTSTTALALLAMSLPFIAVGVILTLRRLRDAGWPLWLVGLFFVPFVNLMFFLVLAAQPARPAHPSAPAPLTAAWRALASDSALAAGTAGVLLSAGLGAILTAFGTVMLKNYGWGLFVGIPFLMGLTSTLVYAAARPRAWFECVFVVISSVAVAGVTLLVLAIEGLLCILMAAPIALPLALLGAGVGYWIQIERWSHRLDQVRVHVAWLALPLLLALEAQLPAAGGEHAATTVCEVDAPPAVVWRHVIAFSDLPPPREAIFRAGIAYPVRARLEGEGVGAVRYCEFSTGAFVEPITAWDDGRRLAFDVTRQPHPMHEWSPYAHLEPAHLEGFFRSKRGEFRLESLEGGRRTRLSGTTWYEQDIWPGAYWKLWSDYLVHRIHERVLNHIRREAEAVPRSPIPPG